MKLLSVPISLLYHWFWTWHGAFLAAIYYEIRLSERANIFLSFLPFPSLTKVGAFYLYAGQLVCLVLQREIQRRWRAHHVYVRFSNELYFLTNAITSHSTVICSIGRCFIYWRRLAAVHKTKKHATERLCRSALRCFIFQLRTLFIPTRIYIYIYK